MKIEDIKVGMMVLLEMGSQESIQVVVLKIGKIQVRVGNASSGSSWVYPKRLIRQDPPIGCDTGTMINQNLPTHLCNVGMRIDPCLPPGTLEIWQDGKRIGRIENIGLR